MDCSRGNSIRKVKNVYDGAYTDRRWKFTCAPLSGLPEYYEWDCTEFPYDYEHKVYEALSFQCPADYFLVGAQSTYSYQATDRQWKFRCCHVPGYNTASCLLTGYQNTWHGEMLEFETQGDRLITGLASYYSHQ